MYSNVDPVASLVNLTKNSKLHRLMCCPCSGLTQLQLSTWFNHHFLGVNLASLEALHL